MKYIFYLILFLPSLANSQIPPGYYDNAEGLSGEDLKIALYNIIKGHKEYPYTSSSTDTWDILKETDRDPQNSANVIGIYSGFSMDGGAEYNNGSGWNREHVWAKSRGDFGTSAGPGTDVHHLRAADISTNSARSNKNFNYCNQQYIDGDGPTESYNCTNEFSWEPRDDVKGDVARMLFYMATRYEGQNGEPDLELTNVLQSESSSAPLHGLLDVILEWHKLDPVSDLERIRNDIIYTYQQNRNPFIDHPEYPDLIWFNKVTAIVQLKFYQIKTYPNPVEDQFVIEINGLDDKDISAKLFDKQAKLIFSLNGDINKTANVIEEKVENLLPGFYFLIISGDQILYKNKILVK